MQYFISSLLVSEGNILISECWAWFENRWGLKSTAKACSADLHPIPCSRTLCQETVSMWAREQWWGLRLQVLMEPTGQAITRKSNRVLHVVRNAYPLAALFAELVIFVFPSARWACCPWSLFTESHSNRLMSSWTVKLRNQEQVQPQPASACFISSLHNSMF